MMDLESKGYASIDPREAMLQFETQALVERFGHVIMDFYNERRKEGEDQTEHTRDTMSIIMNGLCSALGNHLYSMKQMGANINRETVDTLLNKMASGLDLAIKHYEDQH